MAKAEAAASPEAAPSTGSGETAPGREPAQAPPAVPESAFTPSTEAYAPYDPWQKVNRRTYAFSVGLDKRLLGPIAHGYTRLAPQVVRVRIGSVLYNLGEPATALNDLAQGRPGRAAATVTRFVVNSTIGVLGLFDVAGATGLPPHVADFGQTLGRYGVVAGPYIFVPVIGPTNFRDGLGRVVDSLTDPVSLVAGGITSTFGASRAGALALDRRARGDSAVRALDDATDPYATTRSAYAQNRAFVIQSATGKAAEVPAFDPAPVAP